MMRQLLCCRRFVPIITGPFALSSAAVISVSTFLLTILWVCTRLPTASASAITWRASSDTQNVVTIRERENEREPRASERCYTSFYVTWIHYHHRKAPISCLLLLLLLLFYYFIFILFHRHRHISVVNIARAEPSALLHAPSSSSSSLYSIIIDWLEPIVPCAMSHSRPLAYSLLFLYRPSVFPFVCSYSRALHLIDISYQQQQQQQPSKRQSRTIISLNWDHLGREATRVTTTRSYDHPSE